MFESNHGYYFHGFARLAKNDSYTLDENSVGHNVFDVLSNDLGGSAKKLYFLMHGCGPATRSYVSERTGARIFIGADGKLHYDTTGSNYDFDQLAYGQTITETVTYALRVGHGALSFATAKITIAGVNDAPVAEAATAEARRGGPVVTGAVVATDVDAGARLTFALVDPAPAGLVFNADGTWSYDPAAATGDVVVTYSVTDQHGARSTATLTIAVELGNTAPVAEAATAAAVEDGALVTGAVQATDPDPGARLTYSLVNAAPAGLTFNADGSWSFDAANAAWQRLGAGVVEDIVIAYQVVDETGASSQSTLTIRVTGVNDAAVIGGEDRGDVAEDGETSTGGVLSVSDADTGEATFRAGEFAGAYGRLFLQADGTWTYVLDAALVNPLRSGETAQETFTVRSADGTEHDIVVDVHGSDETPPVWTGGGDPTDTYRDWAPTTTLTGTSEAEELYGTNAGEQIVSGDGGDWVFGRGGDDSIITGEGVDFVYGGTGADSIEARGGDDWIYGGSGGDVIHGGAGADFIYGGFGADTLYGEDGADLFSYYGYVEESGDTIVDFQSGVDKIDLRGFHVSAGQISWEMRGSNTVVKLDLGGTSEAEFEIALVGAVDLTLGDFYY